jgi:hypothetical protein
MKKNLLMCRVVLALGLLISATVLKGYYAGDNCCYQETACCVNEAGPLVCGSWGVQVKGGVAPMFYTKRGPIYLTNALLPTPVVTLFKASKYSDVYKTPWIVGGELSYAVTSNIQLFGEVNYRHGSPKTHNFSALFAGQNIPIRERLSPFKAIGGYVGTRFFCDRWFDSVSPFWGFKIGVVHHKAICAATAVAGVASPTPLDIYHKNTVVSGGGQLGFDACVWGDLKFVFAAEIVATAGLKPNRNIVFADPAITLGFTNFNQGDIGTELSFPITFGLRYDF